MTTALIPPQVRDVPRPTSRPGRFALPLAGVGAMLLTGVGLSGVGDAPDPHDTPASMVSHFVDGRTDILAAAPFGYVGAALIVVFFVGLARRLWQRGQTTAAVATAGGGAAVAGYLCALHLVYTSLAYQVAAASGDATKALFVPTILASPLFGVVTATALAGAASGAWRTRLLPRWWAVATGAGAALAASAVGSYADSGFFSPDVQQQAVGNVLLLWLLVTAAVLAAGRGARR